MRVVEVEFDMNVGAGPMGTGSKFTRWFRASDGHAMEWLPEEGVLVIDGWRYSVQGARWRCDEQVPAPSRPDPIVMELEAADVIFTGEAYKELNDGTDQPGAPAGPARGKKRRK